MAIFLGLQTLYPGIRLWNPGDTHTLVNAVAPKRGAHRRPPWFTCREDPDTGAGGTPTRNRADLSPPGNYLCAHPQVPAAPGGKEVVVAGPPKNLKRRCITFQDPINN